MQSIIFRPTICTSVFIYQNDNCTVRTDFFASGYSSPNQTHRCTQLVIPVLTALCYQQIYLQCLINKFKLFTIYCHLIGHFFYCIISKRSCCITNINKREVCLEFSDRSGINGLKGVIFHGQYTRLVYKLSSFTISRKSVQVLHEPICYMTCYLCYFHNLFP